MVCPKSDLLQTPEGSSQSTSAPTCCALYEVSQDIRHLVDLLANLRLRTDSSLSLCHRNSLSRLSFNIRSFCPVALTCPLMTSLTVKVMKSVKSFFSQFGLNNNSKTNTRCDKASDTDGQVLRLRGTQTFCHSLSVSLQMETELVKVQIAVGCVCGHLPFATVWQRRRGTDEETHEGSGQLGLFRDFWDEFEEAQSPSITPFTFVHNKNNVLTKFGVDSEIDLRFNLKVNWLCNVDTGGKRKGRCSRYKVTPSHAQYSFTFDSD